MRSYISAPLALMVASAAANAQVFDAAADFSASSNPNGAWSYGYTTSLGSALNTYSTSQTPTVTYWTEPALNGSPYPNVAHNGTGSTYVNVASSITWATGQLSIHPGPANEKSVVRWTAPAAATVDVAASYTPLDAQAVDTDVHILINGASVYSQILGAFGDVKSHTTTVSVNAGDTIDFVVGYGTTNYFEDTVGVDATIRVPAPGAAVVGIALVVGWSPRRR